MLSLEESDVEPDLPVEVVSCGVPFLYVPLRGLDAARRARPRVDLIERASHEHGTPPEVFAFTRETEGAYSTVHSRMFAPGMGIVEDPATGSASGPLACYLHEHRLLDRARLSHIVSLQGAKMLRPSRIHISLDTNGDAIIRVRVGGRSVIVGEGTLTF